MSGMAHNPLHIAREAQHMAKTASERDAMLLQKVSVGAIVIMALPCAMQAMNEMFRMLKGKESNREHGHGR